MEEKELRNEKTTVYLAPRAVARLRAIAARNYRSFSLQLSMTIDQWLAEHDSGVAREETKGGEA